MHVIVAIQDYDWAIRLNPEYWKAFYNRGIAYADLGQYERAIQDYDAAIPLNPEYAVAYYNRGFTYSPWGQVAWRGCGIADGERGSAG